MAEEPTKKKPRRKRRTKAQIEAEALEKLPKEEPAAPEPVSEAWPSVEEEKVVEEEPVNNAYPLTFRPLETYVPKTGLHKLKKKMSQRRLRDDYLKRSRDK